MNTVGRSDALKKSPSDAYTDQYVSFKRHLQKASIQGVEPCLGLRVLNSF